MGKKVPDSVAKEVREFVFNEADKVNYLARSRTENGSFLTRLLSTPEAGLKLAQYMKKDQVRTYIKDAILNRYSKDKTLEEKPTNLEKNIKELTGQDCEILEQNINSQLCLYRLLSEECLVVVSDGTILKWETALRKALLYIASKPLFDQHTKKVQIILTLFARRQKMSPSNVRQLEKALSLCNAKLHIYGDD